MNAADKIRSIVKDARGDDLERAMIAFRGMSDTELDQEHGESGMSRRQLLETYQKERSDWESASKLAETL